MEDATIVFDLDGTLVDTAPDLTAALNHALAGIGLPPVAPERVRPTIAFGARRMIETGLRLLAHPASEAEIDALLARFLAYYGDHIAVDSRPYPGTIAAMERLIAAGARLGLCTNKRENMTLKLLARLDLDRYFAAIVARDTLDVCKPDPRHLTETVRRSGGEARRAVMIGDSETDIKTAKAACIPVVGVTFGYSEAPIETFEPDAVLDDYRELPELVERLLAASAGPLGA